MPQGGPTGAEQRSARHRRTRIRWVGVTAALAVVVALVSLVAVLTGSTVTSEDVTPSGGTSETAVEPTVGSQAYLDRLANQGYIPKEAVDRDLLLLERLVGRGDIPPEALGSLSYR